VDDRRRSLHPPQRLRAGLRRRRQALALRLDGLRLAEETAAPTSAAMAQGIEIVKQTLEAASSQQP
jgi:hypothetical protein